jgi:hypothetical protein
MLRAGPDPHGEKRQVFNCIIHLNRATQPLPHSYFGNFQITMQQLDFLGNGCRAGSGFSKRDFQVVDQVVCLTLALIITV